MKYRVSVVMTDLDNTLFDWLEMWYRTFSAMLDRLLVESGVERNVLEAEIRQVFQRHGTSEYAFVIQELPSLQRLHPGEDLADRYQSAIEAFREARKASLHLYPGVKETLQAIHEAGSLVVAYTESLAFYSMWRVKYLGLDGLIDYLYSPPDHEMPDLPPERIRPGVPDDYDLQITRRRFLKPGEFKPDPDVLLDIIRGVHAKPEECIYIGDSLMKDVAMAQRAKVTDAYAKYGEARERADYGLLRRVSHWTDADVERERKIHSAGTVQPTLILHKSFSEILEHCDFIPFSPTLARQ
jgi:phosphoglycolate phosphatase-like HAD superfamily hydrolase